VKRSNCTSPVNSAFSRRSRPGMTTGTFLILFGLR
jgi:hypothetical protein